MEKCKLKAKSAVYWIGMYKEIEELFPTCSTCQKHRVSQQKEEMTPTEASSGSLQLFKIHVEEKHAGEDIPEVKEFDWVLSEVNLVDEYGICPEKPTRDPSEELEVLRAERQEATRVVSMLKVVAVLRVAVVRATVQGEVTAQMVVSLSREVAVQGQGERPLSRQVAVAMQVVGLLLGTVVTVVVGWCSCGNCREMPTDAERICCGGGPESCVSGLAKRSIVESLQMLKSSAATTTIQKYPDLGKQFPFAGIIDNKCTKARKWVTQQKEKPRCFQDNSLMTL
ncbi:hypothetical protein Bbelb_186730 [Branchiostoma belcheri]|nr:hypothetical protein Bbelb_186730 [Branchiostoma belcheri]